MESTYEAMREEAEESKRESGRERESTSERAKMSELRVLVSERDSFRPDTP